MSVPAPSGPAHLWIPPGRRGSYLDEVGEVAEVLGQPLDPWGVTAVDAVTSFGPGGRWLTLEACLKMPRQVGKTKGIALPIALTVSTLFEPAPRLWTAHSEKAYLEAFQLAKQWIEGSEEFSRRVDRVREADGDKGLEFANGAILDFGVRSTRIGRSRGIPEHFVDEALFFKAGQAGALLPTMAAQSNPHVLYLSSGAVGSEDGDYLRSLTHRGRVERDATLVFAEWCAPGGWREPGCAQEGCDHSLGVPGCALDDERLWFAAIPSLGIRTSVEFIRSMRRAFRSMPLEFGREFLGWDEEEAASSRPIPVEDWRACGDPGSRIVGGKVWALDVTPDGRRGSVGVAGQRADGLPHGELVDARGGTGWMVPRVVELLARHETRRIRRGEVDHPGVLLDPAGPAAGLVQPLRAAGVEPVLMSARDQGQACAWLQAAVRDRAVRHLGQEQVEAALLGAVPRQVGDGVWAWGRVRSDRAQAQVDISPLVAVTAALWALTVAEAQPEQVFFADWR